MATTDEKRLKLRAVKVTQDMFDHLPGLLSRYQFQLVTGLSDRDLDAMRTSGEIKTRQRKAKGYHKYFKSDAARIANFKL